MAIQACPILALLPVTSTTDIVTIQENFRRIEEWTRRMCQYVDALMASP